MGTEQQAAWIERVLGLSMTKKSPQPSPDIKLMNAEMVGLIGQLADASGGDTARLDALKGLAATANAAIKTGDVITSREAIDALKREIDRKSAPSKPAKTGRPVLDIWRDAKEAVGARITELQGKVLSYPDPALKSTLKLVADRGLNGVTDRASVGMMVAMMEAQSSPQARAKALKAVETFRSFINGEIARGIDNNPFKVKVGLKDTFAKALDQIEAELAS